MAARTENPLLLKREFYNQHEIASRYDEQRFGGASGAWVNAREIELALALLPPSQRLLDLACGTGRLTRELAERGEVVGMDAAAAMLQQAQKTIRAPFAQGDAFTLPFADASFDSVVALRLVFHFADFIPLLEGMRRVVKPGGALVFDTYLWSPRAWLPLDKSRWGGGVFSHPRQEIERAADRLGLQVSEAKPCFLFSPFLYKHLPLPVVQTMARLEDHVPAQLHARLFWKLTRAD